MSELQHLNKCEVRKRTITFDHERDKMEPITRDKIPPHMLERVDIAWNWIKRRWSVSAAHSSEEQWREFERDVTADADRDLVTACYGCGHGYSNETRKYKCYSCPTCMSCDYICCPSPFNPRNAELVEYYGIDLCVGLLMRSPRNVDLRLAEEEVHSRL